MFLIVLVAAPALISLAQTIQPETAPLPDTSTNTAVGPVAPMPVPTQPETAPLPNMSTNPGAAPRRPDAGPGRGPDCDPVADQ